MWVFGYGSLMSDGWEERFGGGRHQGAALEDYRRAFIKKSTVNWGSVERPCPTLGLRPETGARCIGVAFRFDEARSGAVMAYLRGREGPTFEFERHPVALPDSRRVAATVAVNRLDTPAYLGHLRLDERAAMVVGAHGTSGCCRRYIERTVELLRNEGVHDRDVEQFAEALARLEARSKRPSS